MSDGTEIAWTDATWQVSYGCSRVDHRCDNCYAIPLLHRGLTPKHRGLTKHRPPDASRPGVDWTGEVRLAPDNLTQPLRWRRPRRVFVNSLSDLFHKQIPFEYIAAVHGIMAAARAHTFQLLTKRIDRAVDFHTWLRLEAAANDCTPLDICALHLAALRLEVPAPIPWGTAWPLPNVHVGTSVSDQPSFDAEVPILLRVPAALHWLSIEPLLGPIDVSRHVFDRARSISHLMNGPACLNRDQADDIVAYPIDWIVVGGESGQRARPCDTEWIRAIVECCLCARVPVFCKQLGAKPIGVEWELDDAKGGKTSEWPVDLVVRQFPEVRP